MYLPAKFCGHRSYGNKDINSYINRVLLHWISNFTVMRNLCNLSTHAFFALVFFLFFGEIRKTVFWICFFCFIKRLIYHWSNGFGKSFKANLPEKKIWLGWNTVMIPSAKMLANELKYTQARWCFEKVTLIT